MNRLEMLADGEGVKISLEDEEEFFKYITGREIVDNSLIDKEKLGTLTAAYKEVRADIRKAVSLLEKSAGAVLG